MVASLVCCFWPVTVGAGFFAVRGLRRGRDVTPSASLAAGLATGFVSGLLVASFGTAVVLMSASGDEMKLAEALGLGGEGVGLGWIAASHALVGFSSALGFGLLGGAVAGSGPATPSGRKPGRTQISVPAATVAPSAAVVPEEDPPGCSHGPRLTQRSGSRVRGLGYEARGRGRWCRRAGRRRRRRRRYDLARREQSRDPGDASGQRASHLSILPSRSVSQPERCMTPPS